MATTNLVRRKDNLFQDDLTEKYSLKMLGSSNSYPDSQSGCTDTWSASSDSISLYDETPYKRKASVVATDSLVDSLPTGAKTLKSEPLEEKKKPGRKPVQTEPASKRKAQNRAAQRAFRDRKERHLKDLETRVAELENETAVTYSENEFLRFQLQHLQQQLNFYRSKSTSTRSDNNANSKTPMSGFNAPFSFQFPYFSKDNNSNVENIDDLIDIKPSLTSSSSVTSGASSVLSAVSPWESHPVASGINFNGSTDSQYTSSVKDSSVSPSSGSSCSSKSPASSFIDVLPSSAVPKEQAEQRDFCANLSMACGTRANPAPRRAISDRSLPIDLNSSNAPPSGSSTISSPMSSSKTFEMPTTTVSFPNLPYIGDSIVSPNLALPVNPIAPIINRFPLYDNLNVATSIDDLFNYRDVIFDNEDITLPELVNSNTDDIYNQFNPSNNGLIPAQNLYTGNIIGGINSITPEYRHKLSSDKLQTKPDLIPDSIFPQYNLSIADDEPIVPDSSRDLINCSAVWDRITAHPKFDEIDIEGLCTELRTKAKCSEAGVVLNGCDVDNILYKL
ncbi:hypothetical protein NADFUDRAFT_84283 [Nadsonia fulvescens var. elongata DSM 6958]|uniref:BZIP domain-containing protein n=1 Tax=Nadsonia fulvescens var. elongata DSM 6958 TaxID=857566 RepID=A0A1E3PDZ0_9ASCO|nr:hypothetical protein NADFUDRAFT_84283 [Nadsonia fulvescens var. elongata DSM 6958]